VFSRAYLECGCCGELFYTWAEYVDQGQDNNFGICAGCQDDAQRQSDKIYADTADVVRSHLKRANRQKWDKQPTAIKRAVILKFIQDGTLKWQIRGAS